MWAAVRTGCTFALHPERLALLNARRHLDSERRLVADVALAATGVTALRVEGPLALTLRAGRRLLDAAERRLLNLRHLPATLTFRASPGLGVRRMALPAAVIALLGALDGELLLDALEGLLEFDIEFGAQIAALLGPTATPTAAAAAAPEDLLEDVAETAATHAATAHAAERAAAHTATHAALAGIEAVFLGLFVAVVAHAIVGLALFLVGQDLLCLLDFLELLLGVRVVADVRMVLRGLLPVRLFDLLGVRVWTHTEYVVEVLAHSLFHRYSVEPLETTVPRKRSPVACLQYTRHPIGHLAAELGTLRAGRRSAADSFLSG
ncbi:putative glutamate dehydrogenase [Natrialba taiwanensis DSM 12281]|uniref:Putative glutamate dehydrogenase n=1 Tax=Natrialba taiwanensis DSM 12281 TaxID=1230458 RepID=M0ADR5_9EURY|nr:putative glutamate dehydrogenase [Natrialba taiwanensis DSM 12281]